MCWAFPIKSHEPVHYSVLSFSWCSFSPSVVLSCKDLKNWFLTGWATFLPPFHFVIPCPFKAWKSIVLCWLPSLCLPPACAFLSLHLLAACGTAAHFLLYHITCALRGKAGYCYGHTLAQNFHLLSVFTSSLRLCKFFSFLGWNGWLKVGMCVFAVHLGYVASV